MRARRGDATKRIVAPLVREDRGPFQAADAGQIGIKSARQPAPIPDGQRSRSFRPFAGSQRVPGWPFWRAGLGSEPRCSGSGAGSRDQARRGHPDHARRSAASKNQAARDRRASVKVALLTESKLATPILAWKTPLAFAVAEF